MLFLNMERDEKKVENEKETFSSSGCYNKDWVLLTNNQQKLNHLICCICKQIANKLQTNCKQIANKLQTNCKQI
ncbi:hypothetical protein RFI_01184, partial [Reticulomyxa filosa]